MNAFVIDTSVLIDLERGGNLLKACFALPFEFSVPGQMFRGELKDRMESNLIELGLRVEEVDHVGAALARSIRQRSRFVTIVDSLALSLAKVNGRMLLTGDKALSKLAKEFGVPCHGVLWLIDIIFEFGLLNPKSILAGLESIANHPRCRLPAAEIRKRRLRYSTEEH